MAADVQEYEYDLPHLTGDEALDLYRSLKESQRDTLIILEDLHCGHWQVKQLSTEAEKDQYLAERMAKALRTVMRHFSTVIAK